MTREINGQTRLVGVMGWPVEHTMSPHMHNAAYAELGMNCCYVPLAVKPEGLADAVAGLHALGFAGCNITVPHKQGVFDCLDEVSEEAQIVGAVNTLVRKARGWAGGNSDLHGFLMSLDEERVTLKGKRSLVLGAGGAARGLVYALASQGAEIVLMNRTLARAEGLAKEMEAAFPGAMAAALPMEEGLLLQEAERAELFVNTTSLGMWPEVGRSPWPEGTPFPSHQVVFDAVYNPLRTRLMEQAEASGARAIGGLKMLVYQGAVAFDWWFGVMPPAETMYQVARRRLLEE
jgi:shikimate dehydrogenase